MIWLFKIRLVYTADHAAGLNITNNNLAWLIQRVVSPIIYSTVYLIEYQHHIKV